MVAYRCHHPGPAQADSLPQWGHVKRRSLPVTRSAFVKRKYLPHATQAVSTSPAASPHLGHASSGSGKLGGRSRPLVASSRASQNFSTLAYRHSWPQLVHPNTSRLHPSPSAAVARRGWSPCPNRSETAEASSANTSKPHFTLGCRPSKRSRRCLRPMAAFFLQWQPHSTAPPAPRPDRHRKNFFLQSLRRNARIQPERHRATFTLTLRQSSTTGAKPASTPPRRGGAAGFFRLGQNESCGILVGGLARSGKEGSDACSNAHFL